MTQPDDPDPDRLPPRIVRPGERAAHEAGWGDPDDWEQYEHSGTYLHGRGAFKALVQATQPTLIEHSKGTADYIARAVWAGIGVGVLALFAFVGFIWSRLANGTHHAQAAAAPAASHGPALGSGKVFGLLVFAVVIFVAVRYIARLFKGE